MVVRRIFTFPDPVNETSARLVAAGVVAQAVLFAVLREGWLLVPLVYGFAARVASGPTLSPLGQFVTRLATPAVERTFRVESRRVAGPPKRFAQAVGLAFSGSAALAWLLGAPVVTLVVLSMLVAAASLESAAGICLGCIGYNAIWGCADCSDISERLRAAVAASQRTVDVAPTGPATR